MRRAAILLPLLILGACQSEPDFEERFDKASAEIEGRAKAMDADIAEADKAAGAGKEASVKALPSDAPPSNPPASSGE